MKTIKEEVRKRCESLLNLRVLSVCPLAGSGSSREYFRVLTSHGTVIFCQSVDKIENETFIKLSYYLREKGISVPEILSVSDSYECYVLQDLGDESFLDFLNSQSRESLFGPMIHSIMEGLVKFQTLPRQEWNDLIGFEPFGANLIRNDFEYVITYLFEPSQIDFDRVKLSEDFMKLEKILLSYPTRNYGLMFRDFQSRNIMIHDRPYFIDYQSARFGPGIYDLVSFAWQAKARFSDRERRMIIDSYVFNFKQAGIDIEKCVKNYVYYWAIFRILQTLGAYGRRGLLEGKKHFIESIPFALSNLVNILKEKVEVMFPELERIITILYSKNTPEKNS